MKIALILAAAAVAANLIYLWYAKRRICIENTSDVSHFQDGSRANPHKVLDSPEGRQLKQSAAAELRISLEELERMSAEEIKQLAKEQELI